MKPTNQSIKIYDSTHLVGAENGRLVANCGGYASNKTTRARDENIANAELITALWNLARSLNPADPLAAANALPDVVAAAQKIVDYLCPVQYGWAETKTGIALAALEDSLIALKGAK